MTIAMDQPGKRSQRLRQSIGGSQNAKNQYTWSIKAIKEQNYHVLLLDGLLNNNIAELTNRLKSQRGIFVTTPTVAKLYGGILREFLVKRAINYPTLILDCKEHSKSLCQVERVCAFAYEHGLDRRSIVVGLGGGVCLDIVTMAAAWIRRGVKYICIPTTLISQIDAGIGIKGAVNFKGKKSALGCFYPPDSVLIDPIFLKTLPKHHLRAGFSEIIKISIVRDRVLFDLLEKHAIPLIANRVTSLESEKREINWRAISRMLEELEPNLYEDRGYKRLVDFGHVFSPLLEAASNYTISHGDAVAIDMALTCAISCEMGILSVAELDRIYSLLRTMGLPIFSELLTESLCESALNESAAHRGGRINLILPTRIGTATVLEKRQDLPRDILKSALESITISTPSISLEAKKRKLCLVFDIGGSKLRAAQYHSDSRTVSHVTTVSTPNYCTMPNETSQLDIYYSLIRRMDELSIKVLNGKAPDVISIAFPGPIDNRGNAFSAPTIWREAPDEPINLIGDMYSQWPNSEIYVLNDVSAAGYRYITNCNEDFCIITVSSGIGNKIFVNGKPITGIRGRGGEIGHLRVDFSKEAPVCDCGGIGHLGAIASGRGVLNLARRMATNKNFSTSLLAGKDDFDSEKLTTADLVEAFHQNDPWTISVIRKAVAPLARTLVGIHLSLGIERFIIIGGFALALGEPYRKELIRTAEQLCWQIGQNWDTMIELGPSDDLSGLIGAGRFCMDFKRTTT